MGVSFATSLAYCSCSGVRCQRMSGMCYKLLLSKAQCGLGKISSAIVGWVGLGGTTGTGSLTRSRNCSLAPNVSLRTLTSHQKELFQRKETLHSLMCTGKFTQTGATLTVFLSRVPGMKHPWLQYSSWYSIYFIPQEPGERNKRRPINLITKNAYSYASTPVTIIPTLTWCPQREP